MKQRMPDVAKLLKNGIANIATGGSAAILTLIVPFFLVRLLRPDDFSLWMLLFPLANYFNFIGLGFQVSLSRFIAVGKANHSSNQQARLLRQAIVQVAVISLLVLAGFGLVSLRLQDIFPSINPSLISSGRLTLFLLCIANAISLPFSLFGAVFIGIQRNDLNAIIQLSARSFIAIATIGLAFMSCELGFVAIAYLVAMVLSSLGQYFFFRHVAPFGHTEAPFNSIGSNLVTGRTFLSYSLSLSVWSAVSLFLVAVPTSIVGALDYAAVAGFSLANTLLAFFIGIYNALITPMTQSVAARYGSAHDSVDFHMELRRFSFICTVLLILSSAWLIVLAPAFMMAWVGPQRALEALPFIIWLTLANVLRNMQSPFLVFVIAVGKQSKIFWLPIIEAVIATAGSLCFGATYGAFAVGISLSVAAAISAAITTTIAVPLVLGDQHDYKSYLSDSFLRPLTLTSPVIAVVVSQSWLTSQSVLFILMVLSSGISLWLVWRRTTLRA